MVFVFPFTIITMGPQAIQHLQTLDHWVYLALFIGMLFEGETFLFIAFYLVHQGHLSLTLALISGFSGVLTGDFLWYMVGHYLNRFDFLRKKIELVSGPIDRQLRARPFRTLFVSKFAYGIHRLTQIRSGALRIDGKTFWRADIPAAFLFVVGIASLGYFVSLSVAAAHHYIRYAQLGLLFGIVVLWLGARIVGHINRHYLHIPDDITDESKRDAT